MEALRTHHIGEGGDMHMESALTDIDGKDRKGREGGIRGAERAPDRPN